MKRVAGRPLGASAMWLVVLAVVSLSYTAATAPAQNRGAGEHWVATWASSPQQPPAGQRGQAAPPADGRGARGPAPGAAAPAGPPRGGQRGGQVVGLNDQTIRMFVRTSLGGQRLRVEFSNAYGATPLQIGAAHVGLRSQGSAIAAGSDRQLTFNGKKTVRIPPGVVILSDPADLGVPKLADLAISVYTPADTGPVTRHTMALRSAYVVAGDATGQAALAADAATVNSWFIVSRVDVSAPQNAGTIVAFGDSITDGATSTPETNRSWPSILAERLAQNPATADIAVVNHGVKVIGCTLTPYVGAGYASEAGESVRSAVNNWIRTSGAFDAVVDFDAATRDPANSNQFLPAYNNTDHLHPNDAGYKAMAESIDLTIFTRLR